MPPRKKICFFWHCTFWHCTNCRSVKPFSEATPFSLITKLFVEQSRLNRVCKIAHSMSSIHKTSKSCSHWEYLWTNQIPYPELHWRPRIFVHLPLCRNPVWSSTVIQLSTFIAKQQHRIFVSSMSPFHLLNHFAWWLIPIKLPTWPNSKQTKHLKTQQKFPNSLIYQAID